MSHADRDLTPILDHVARAQYDRMLSRLDDEHRAAAPPFEQMTPGDRNALKQALLPVVGDVLAALDAQEQDDENADLFAAFEAQFSGDPNGDNG